MRKLMFLVVVVSIVSLGIGYYMYQMPPKNLSKIKPEKTVSADALMASFEENEDSANKAFLGKIIEVSGMVSGVVLNEDGSTQIMLESQSLMGGISCNFEREDAAKLRSDLESGHNVLIKGKCTGFLMDVVLERCVFVKYIEQ